jgi:deazaflavin-dependent oxidoreductase (nitroreductase family)
VDEAIERALESDRTIDITTTGRRSGEPRRIEIWMHHIDGRTFISGLPGRRGWYANLRAHPEFILQLKGSLEADLPAVARSIEDEQERREVIERIFDGTGRERAEVDAWVADSPLVEVEFKPE